MKLVVVRRVAVAVVAALVATVVQVAPIQAQAQGDVEGLVSPDLAFTELDESVEVDVIANDDGVELFEADPVLTVTGQPNAATFTVVLDAEDGTPMLLLTPDVGWGGIARGTYRACWGDQCGSAQVEVYVGTSECTIVGTGGRDTLRGTPGNDVICALGGADVINARGGNDIVFGGKGADEINGGAGADSLYGGRGADLINGGGGDDFLYGRRGNDTLDGGNGADALHGNRGQDVLLGGNGADELYGGRNDDELRGQDGRDVLKGRKGADLLIGGANDDELYGNRGADRLRGQAGDDVLDGGRGTDELSGGGGTDTCSRGETYNGCEEIVEPPDEEDADGDGVPDAEDPDDDNDGIPDELDEFPLDPGESSDTDGDGIGDNSDPDADNDGVLNEDDDFPFDDSETVDSDGGGLGDNADPDDDDDGVFDDVDVFPNDGTEWEDTDGDGVGDNADTDDDNDGVPDVDDAFPKDPTETKDSDFDGIGDNADDDDDNDGVPDADDAFPADSLVSLDTDGDGIGDLLDDDNDGDGVNDFADAFPNDPTEQFDTDLDGVGNNADTDDDDDTFLDDDDAFRLDPDEWEDLNGNGVGDNQDAVNDLDGDGTPDVDDPDIDGDLVENGDDAFPRDPTEWSDLDGDGIGDNTDTDDDGDGVEDAEDLLPNDPNAGVDSDLDGTPDAFDAAPDDANDPRFMVEAEEPSGAATEIISDSLILPEEVVITEIAVEQDDPIETVAASEIVDFEIEGPVTEFTTARITIPIDPVLAQQPDPVEVWWLNEEYGLWVPDGTELQVDAANATVSVTVDHFSRFIALRKGANPFIVQSGTSPAVCVDTGVDVFLLVDDSGSNEFDYLVGGAEIEASDPETVISEPGQPPLTVTPERVEAARDLTLGLNEDTDRIAVAGFAEGIESTDLDYIGDSTSGYLPVIEAVRQLVAEPASGTDLIGALQSASGFLLGAQGSDRAKVIVVLSDGGTGSFDAADVVGVVDESVVVHVVGIGDSPNPALETVAQARGGVYAPNRNNPLFGSMLQRIDELNVDVGEVDFDNDTLTDCEEIRGMPTVQSLVWRLPGNPIGEFFAETWFTSDPELADSDGDFLWDSEEMVRVDLNSEPELRSTYAAVIATGLTSIFRFRGDPENQQSPIRDDGSQAIAFRPTAIPEAIRSPMQSELAEVQAQGDAIDAPQVEKTTVRAYETALVHTLGIETTDFESIYGVLNVEAAFESEQYFREIVSRRVGPSFDDDAPGIDLFAPRLDTLFDSTARVGNPNIDLTPGEIEALAAIEEINRSVLLNGDSLSLQAWNANVKFRLDKLRGLLARLADSPDEIDELVVKFDALLAVGVQVRVGPGPSPFDPPEYKKIRLDSRGAYRLLKLFEISPFEFNRRVAELVELFDYDLLARSAGKTADQLGLLEDRYLQLLLELETGVAQQEQRFLEAVGPTSPFLSGPQTEALRVVMENFERLSTQTREGIIERSDVLDEDGDVERVRWGVQDLSIKHLLWVEDGSELQGLMSAEASAALPLMWDDLAMSRSSRFTVTDQWAEQFDEDVGFLDQSDINADRLWSWEEYAASAEDEALTEAQNNKLSGEDHPGVITAEDLRRFGALMDAYSFFSALYHEIETFDQKPEEADGVLTRGDLEDFLESVADDALYPAVIQARLQQVIDEGFFDDTFSIDDLILVLQVVGVVLNVAAGVSAVVLTGGAASPAVLALLAAATASELVAVSLNVSEGNVGAAIFDGIFLLADVATLGKVAAELAVTGLRRALVRSSELTQGIVGAARRGASSDELGDALAAGVRSQSGPDDEFAAVVDLRPDDVELSAGTSLAVSHYVERPAMRAALRAEGLDGIEANALTSAVLANSVEELDEAGRAAYRAADDVLVDDQAVVGVVRAGDEAVTDPTVRGAFDSCPAPPITVPVGNSFSGDTLVALADGTRVPIAEVQVGDVVLAFDFGAGTTVSRAVTATLPHTDWLLEAHFSDGSVMSVTEDHRFWSITDDDWVELQDLDPTDDLLTPDGATVTVDWLDWHAGVTAPAWDLTVAEVHNFFVAADGFAELLLVHNANGGVWCGLPLRADLFEELDELTLTPSQADAIRSRVLGGDPKLTPDEKLGFAQAIANSPDPQLAATRAAAHPLLAKQAARAHQVAEVLSAADFETAVLRIDELYESFIDSGFDGTPVGFASPEAFDDATALIRDTFGDPDLIVGVRGSSVTGLSFKNGTVGNGIGDIDIFVVSDDVYQTGLLAGATGKDGALSVGDTGLVAAWDELQDEIAAQFVDRLAFPEGLETSIRIFSEDGFAQVRTGWEVLN